MARSASDAYDASLQMLACLTIAVQAAANPPKNIQFLPGAQAGEDLSEYNDLCCEGTAFVRMTTTYPSYQDFPAPDSLAIPCQQQAIALNYEVGIMRCAPGGTIAFVAKAENWRVAYQQEMTDMKSLYTTLCCYQGQFIDDAMVMGAWNPVGPQGGCLMGVINLSHQIMGCGGLCDH
jgi:hypothetical protein